MQTFSPAGLPRSLVLLTLGALALAACDDNGTVNKRGINGLGDCFVDAFNRDRNDEPIDASGCDLTLTPTVEPFNP